MRCPLPERPAIHQIVVRRTSLHGQLHPRRLANSPGPSDSTDRCRVFLVDPPATESQEPYHAYQDGDRQ